MRLSHLALTVQNLEAAVDFYGRILGMEVVWQPDPDNVYLSFGADNLALHRGFLQHDRHRAVLFRR